MSEREWVESLQGLLQPELIGCDHEQWHVEVCSEKKLTYAHEILRYDKDGVGTGQSAGYATDLLIRDISNNGDWIPRVVLECKLASVTTHDALTYSTKAATHKHVHPYLRYGILVGGDGDSIPGRLIRHGAFFDFMMAWESKELGLAKLAKLLEEEIEASRELDALLTDTRSRGRKKVRLLHRHLFVKDASE